MVKNLPVVQETRFDPWVRRIPWRREWLPIQRIGFQSYFRGMWVTGGSKAILFPSPTQFKIMVKHVPWEAIFKNWLKTCYLIIFSVFTNVLYLLYVTSLVAQIVKRLFTMRETQVRSLGWEDPLEKEMAIHSRAIAWKIPWTEEPGRLQSMGSQRVRHTERFHSFTHYLRTKYSS